MDLDLKNLGLTLWYIGLGPEKYLMNYLIGLGLILWYIGASLEKYSDYLNWIWTDFMIYWTWTKLLESDFFYYNQAEMLLEKYENLLELSDKQLVIPSSVADSIFLGQSMCGV